MFRRPIAISPLGSVVEMSVNGRVRPMAVDLGVRKIVPQHGANRPVDLAQPRVIVQPKVNDVECARLIVRNTQDPMFPTGVAEVGSRKRDLQLK